MLISSIATLAVVAVLVWALFFPRMPRPHKIYVACLGIATLLALLVDMFYPSRAGGWRPIFLYTFVALAASIGIVGLMEYGLLRLMGMWRLGALVRVTYYEILLQPFTLVVLAVTTLVIAVCTLIPYYTFSEDNKMFRDVATQFVLLAVLAIMVYAAAKVVDEEIENRTMLTLMSKPISRWQVILGKYLGILAVTLVVLAVLGTITTTASFLHWLDVKALDINSAYNPKEYADLMSEVHKNGWALLPLFVLQFFQIATLAAIAVAVSTRCALALNVTIIAVIYVVANLAGFLPGMELAKPWGPMAQFGAHFLPALANFDISQRLIYGDYILGSWESAKYLGQTLPTYAQIWGYTAWSGVYALLYIGASLALALVLFRTRELT